jgi:hypothetical protein
LAEWTPKVVAKRLVEAADVLMSLRSQPGTSDGVSGAEVFGFTDHPVLNGASQCSLLSTDAISRMQQTLHWLTWLEPPDAQIVWARAQRLRWKMICWRLGISRPTADRRWNYALMLIAFRLNGKPLPPNMPRRKFVLQQQP